MQELTESFQWISEILVCNFFQLTVEAYRSENSYLVTFTLFMISKNRPELLKTAEGVTTLVKNVFLPVVPKR